MKRNNYLQNRFFASFVPVCIIAVMAFSLTNVVDSFVASNIIGGNALAAVEITAPITALLAVVSGILGGGALTLCTYYIGEGREERVAPIFTLTILLGAALGLVLAVLSRVMPESLAAAMGADEELIGEAGDYISGIAWGCVPMVMSFMLMNFVRMDGSEMLPMIATVCSTLTNIVLDFVLAGTMKMGVLGLALATSISNAFSMCVNLTHFFKKKRLLRLTSFVKRGVGGDFKKTLRFGTPEALNTFGQVVRGIFLNFILVGLGGAAAMNTLAIQTTVNSILCAIPQGVGSALNFNIGVYFGEKDDGAIVAAMKTAFRIGFALCGALLIVLLIFAEQVVGFFGTGTPEAAVAIRYLGFALLFNCGTEIFVRYFQSVHNIKLSYFVGVMHQCGFLIPCVYVLTPMMSVTGVWLSMVLAEALTLLGLIVLVWLKNRRIPRFVDLLTLPEEITRKTVMEFSVEGNPKAAEEAVLQVQNSLGETAAEALRILSDNLLTHGYKKGKHWFDVRFSRIKDDSLQLCLRDDGRAFDPTVWLQDHPEANSDLCRLKSIAKSIDYHYTMRTNNTFVVLK